MALSDWQEFLREREPQSASDQTTGPAVFDLSHLACLWVEGPDAAKFLQGQVTCDMEQVTPTQSRRGAICNLQGRMICSFRALRRADEPQAFGLIMHRGLIDEVQQWLGKYIVFSKAELRRDDDEVVIGLQDVSADSSTSWFDETPAAPLQVAQSEHGLLTRIDDHRLLTLLPLTEAKALWQSLSRDYTTFGSEAWTLADIHAGLAAVEPATAGELLPQMIALHVDDGVSFTKGCYLGQEVVARMHYRGKLKKHLYRAKIETDAVPEPGASLYTEGQSQSVGIVVQSAGIGPNACELLAVVNDAAVEKDTVYSDTEGNAKLEFLNLPFSVATS